MSAEMEELYRAAVGEKKAEYYVPRFLAFDDAGKGSIGWHWPAFFVTFGWLLWRRMWAVAGLYFVVPSIIMFGMQMAAPFFIVDNPESALISLGIFFLLFMLVMWLVPPLFAVRVYHGHTKERIKELKAKRHRKGLDTSHSALVAALEEQPHVSKLALWLYLILFVGVAGLGVLAAVAVPAYQQYALRAKVTTGYMEAQMRLIPHSGQHMDEVPWDTLDDTPSSNATAKPAGRLRVDHKVHSVYLTFDKSEASQVSEAQLKFEPVVGDDGIILGWTCSSPDIEDRYLPKQCRSDEYED
ncbi:DUF2628 domain-containing protein [Hydrogenophaga sp. 5NK40-0174]|uniref:pilin n=1 Tax=Hydrogenophaga sp. 5NK40-0174 TaxID=3127649 RepID=UPI0031098913